MDVTMFEDLEKKLDRKEIKRKFTGHMIDRYISRLLFIYFF